MTEVENKQQTLRIDIPADTSIKHYLKKNGIILNLPCNGRGSCGKCLVRVVNGKLPAGLRDVYVLPDKAIAAGYRIGCQAVTRGEPITIEISPAVYHRSEPKQSFFSKLFARR